MLLTDKKEWNFALCNNTDGLRGHYAKWNKPDKDKYCIISLMCRIQKIQQTSEYDKKKQTHRYTKQTCGYQSREGQHEGGGVEGTIVGCEVSSRVNCTTCENSTVL